MPVLGISQKLGEERMRTLGQLIRYGVVGVISNAAAFCVYLTVTYLGVPPKIAMTVLYAAGATLGFFGNRSITFSHSGSMSKAAARYTLAHVMGYLLNLTMLLVFADRMGYPHQAVQFSAIFIVAAFLFTLQKLFVFKDGAQ